MEDKDTLKVKILDIAIKLIEGDGEKLSVELIQKKYFELLYAIKMPGF